MATHPKNWSDPSARPSDPLWRVYARLSLEGDDDTTGVDRQMDDGLKEARRRGARKVQFYADRSISAYKRGVIRPDFEMLLSDIAAQKPPVGGLIAWKAERLARQPRDAERLLDALGADDDPPHAVAYTIADGVDTSTEAGLFVFRQLVQFGRWESRAIAQRVARAHKATIEAGGFTGSPPAFGHKDGTKWSQVEPAEAAAIQDAAIRVIAGEGVRSITRDWQAKGIVTREGRARDGSPSKGWQHRAFIMMITSPRIAGLRLVRGVETSGVGEDGQPLIAPILDEATWREVRRILLDPARRPLHPGGEPRHLLTNLMRCSTCRGPLRAKGMGGKNKGPHYWTYSCLRDAYHATACGGIHIHGAKTDAYIEGIVLAALADPGIKAALAMGLNAGGSVDSGQVDADELELRRELGALTERIIEVEAAWMAGPAALEERFTISPEGYKRWRTEANGRRDELEGQISRSARAKVVFAAVADPVVFWTQAALSDKRELIKLLLPEIVVVPARSVVSPTRYWDPRRILITPLGA